MGYALKIYEAFREYGEEKARILAEAFEELEKRYPQILDMATRKDLSETELKLTKEIEGVRLEVEQVRKEIHETKSSLIKWMFFFWTGQLKTLATLLKLMLH